QDRVARPHRQRIATGVVAMGDLLAEVAPTIAASERTRRNHDRDNELALAVSLASNSVHNRRIHGKIRAELAVRYHIFWRVSARANTPPRSCTASANNDSILRLATWLGQTQLAEPLRPKGW